MTAECRALVGARRHTVAAETKTPKAARGRWVGGRPLTDAAKGREHTDRSAADPPPRCRPRNHRRPPPTVPKNAPIFDDASSKWLE